MCFTLVANQNKNSPQAIRGLGAGIFIPNCIDTARRWSLGNEAGMLVAITGCMMFIGTGMGPFTFGLLSKYAGWRLVYSNHADKSKTDFMGIG